MSNEVDNGLQANLLRNRFNVNTIPIYAIDENGRCTCGKAECKAVGKHPVSWAREARAGESYGVKTGSGLGVLDIDLKGRALEDVLTKVEEAFGPLPDTFAVSTGGGGMHFYFRCDTPTKNMVDILGPRSGVDFRGEGGMVVGPGSNHRSGHSYTVALDSPLASIPGPLLDIVRKTVLPKEERTPTQREALESGSEQEAAAVAFFVKRITEEMPPSIEGQGGDQALWQVAVQAASLCLAPELATALVCEHFNPRCQPPWDEKTIERKVNQAWEKSFVQTLDPDAVAFLDRRRQMAQDADTPEVMRFEVPEFTRTRKIPNPNHTYKYIATSGEKPDKLKPLMPADVIYVLVNHPDWDGVWQWDSRAGALVCVCPPLELDAERGLGLTKRDRMAIRCWFNSQGSMVDKDDLEACVEEAARANSFHSLREYLDALPVFDIKAAHETFDGLANVLFSDDASPIESDFLKKFCISAVKRAYKPGTQVDNMLVLYGKEGTGKSTFARVLFGRENYLEQMPEKLRGRDASHMLQGKWCVEFSELETILRLDENEVKQWLSRETDEYRAFGNGVLIKKPRETVFLGTTNEQDFLRDTAATNRRYWPIEVTKRIDRDFLAELRDSIWAAAKTLADSGELHYYEDENRVDLAESRQKYLRTDDWEEPIFRELAGREFVTGIQIFIDAIMPEKKEALLKFNRAEQRRVGNILRQLGCRKGVRTVNGIERKGYILPDSITALPLSNSGKAEKASKN
ncbi:MAG: hypothetical protein E6R03_15805 [Hyphomicrobiaceae bacterium]|nr:MAG: hypothetical protein E6R03_15805 [Hyphomicrobiaceae bacterium]